MSARSRFLDWLDDPRFCSTCGEAIRVENEPLYDERTGKPLDNWYWHCPEVYITVTRRALTATWHGSRHHVYGQGRPRWHRLDALEAGT